MFSKNSKAHPTHRPARRRRAQPKRTPATTSISGHGRAPDLARQPPCPLQGPGLALRSLRPDPTPRSAQRCVPDHAGPPHVAQRAPASQLLGHLRARDSGFRRPVATTTTGLESAPHQICRYSPNFSSYIIGGKRDVGNL